MTNLLQFADVPEWGAGRHWSWFMALLLGDCRPGPGRLSRGHLAPVGSPA